MEFSRRDLRWCQGNMQYFKLLTMAGLKPVSRFHLMFAIWMYLGSPAWMAMMGIGTVLLALSETATTQYIPVQPGAGTALFTITLIMTFSPKLATMLDVFLDARTRRAFGGGLAFALNMAAEWVFMLFLAPIVALAHTMFMIRLFILRKGLSWNSQTRDSHAVPWRLAFAKLWPQTLAGCIVLGVVTVKSPHDFWFALMGTIGMILAVPFAVASASPVAGRLFAKLGIAKLPEEHRHPEALLPLRLPAIELNKRGAAPAASA
jgi:membrane glycosyltransferase